MVYVQQYQKNFYVQTSTAINPPAITLPAPGYAATAAFVLCADSEGLDVSVEVLATEFELVVRDDGICVVDKWEDV